MQVFFQPVTRISEEKKNCSKIFQLFCLDQEQQKVSEVFNVWRPCGQQACPWMNYFHNLVPGLLRGGWGGVRSEISSWKKLKDTEARKRHFKRIINNRVFLRVCLYLFVCCVFAHTCVLSLFMSLLSLLLVIIITIVINTTIDVKTFIIYNLKLTNTKEKKNSNSQEKKKRHFPLPRDAPPAINHGTAPTAEKT